MSEQFPYGDIIIIALIAGFILLRLRSILGQKDDRPPSDFTSNFFKPQGQKQGEPDRIVVLGEVKPHQPRKEEASDPYLATLGEGLISQAVGEIKSKDPLFTATSFLAGAKMAFEMVFDAFNKGDKQTLNMLLSQAIYDDFAKEIDNRAANNSRETTLLSALAKEIKDIKLNRNTAQISVVFESEQVTVERDKEGKITAGDPSDVKTVRDEWVFERDITSKSPNWKIIET